MTTTKDLIVVIMMTSLNAGGVNMKNALEKLQWNYKILGLGDKWQGWTTRMQMYADFARSQENQNTIIVFIDAYDALPARKPDGFIELFQSFACDIVVGAENVCSLNCTPITQWWKKNNIIKENFGNEYVQAGCVVGKAFALSKMYDWCIAKKYTDDQIGIAQYINSNVCNEISLDFANKIAFQDNNGATGIVCINERSNIQMSRSNLVSEPYFIHFPAFLTFRSWPLIHVDKIPELDNYDFVGKHVLSNDFVTIGQIDGRTYLISNLIFLIIFILLIVLCFAFVFVIMDQKKKLRRQSGVQTQNARFSTFVEKNNNYK